MAALFISFSTRVMRLGGLRLSKPRRSIRGAPWSKLIGHQQKCCKQTHRTNNVTYKIETVHACGKIPLDPPDSTDLFVLMTDNLWAIFIPIRRVSMLMIRRGLCMKMEKICKRISDSWYLVLLEGCEMGWPYSVLQLKNHGKVH